MFKYNVQVSISTIQMTTSYVDASVPIVRIIVERSWVHDAEVL